MAIPAKCSENFLETELDGEILLVDLEGGQLMSMAGTARAIWQLIDGTRSEEDIVSALLDRYRGVSRKEVSAFLDDLERSDIVVRG